jgi:hypothetical protein
MSGQMNVPVDEKATAVEAVDQLISLVKPVFRECKHWRKEPNEYPIKDHRNQHLKMLKQGRIYS